MTEKEILYHGPQSTVMVNGHVDEDHAFINEVTDYGITSDSAGCRGDVFIFIVNTIPLSVATSGHIIMPSAIRHIVLMTQSTL